MASKTIIGQCALCRQKNVELKLSHIVPHLVGRYLAKTSPGSLRSTANPNKPVQDIEKHYLLCGRCEELFSAKETWFSNNIFLPYKNGLKCEFDYGKDLAYFIVSLSWRSLYLDLDDYVKNQSLSLENLAVLFHAEQVMREFLLGQREDLENIENHMFFLDRVDHNDYTKTLAGLNQTLHRSITSYSRCADKTIFTISNLAGIMIVTFYSMDAQEQWLNTKIELNGGCVRAKNQYVNSAVGQDIARWSNQIEDMNNTLSDTQKKKIQDKCEKLGDAIKKYPIYQDWLDDYSEK